jgi:cleavage and polyadenylation specificity factor subunit 4
MLPRIEDDTLHGEMGGFSRVSDHKRRKIVCKHWLLGLCHNGMRCDYLHRLDRNKMPPCKHGKLCKIKNCPLKHVGEEELEECQYYKQGFCYAGPKCNRRHEKRTPEECPVEAAFDQGPHTHKDPSNKDSTGSNATINPITNPVAAANLAKKQKVEKQRSENFKVTLCNHWLSTGSCPFNEGCIFAHGEDEINQSNQMMAEFLVDEDICDPTRNIMGIPLELPFAENARVQYYILQAPDLRSLAIAKRRSVWMVPARLAAEMNAARKASGNVVLFFCVRALRGIYGVAKLAGPITQTPQTAPMSAEFSIHWLRSCRVSLSTVAQLKLGNSGMFVGRSSTDGRFDNRVGLELLLTIYRKPVWEWDKDLDIAQANIRVVEKPGDPPGEYFPVEGRTPEQLASLLHPDTLFAPEWIQRALLPTNEKGVLLLGNNGRPLPPDSFNSPYNNAGPPAELYTGNDPGFIACGTKPQIEEMLGRMLLGLPSVFVDLKIAVGAPIFLFDATASIMLGVFFATTGLQHMLVPNAFWDGVNCTLPLQLCFRPAFESFPAQVNFQDPELHAVAGESVRNLGVIGPAEARQLCNLFSRRYHAAQQLMRPQQQFHNNNRRPNFGNSNSNNFGSKFNRKM